MNGVDHVAPRSALVAYGSETGNAQDVAEELGRLARRLHFTARVTELNNVGLNDLVHHDLVLVAISTTGQGALPANAQGFWKRLRSNRLHSASLKSVNFASFGIGDSSYPQFNWAHRKLNNRLRQIGAESVCERGESDEQHPEGIDGFFVPWAQILKERLLGCYPLPTGLSAISGDAFLTPEWSLEPKEPYVNCDGPVEDSNQGVETDQAHLEGFAPVPGAIDATLVANSRVTPSTHWQDVRLFEFLTPYTEYGPGDVLTIYPKNFQEDVDQLLTLLGWDAVSDKPMHFVPTAVSPTQVPSPPVPNARFGATTTLRELLMHHLDINAIPRRSFFAAIAHFTDDEAQKERLIEFTKPELFDELYDYTTRPRRSIVEVLQEFNTVKLPYRWITAIFPVIRGRQFSIASGGALKHGPNGTTRFELLVAIVKYRTVIRKTRQGLCTRYMADLKPGTKLAVHLSKSGMKVALDLPAVMIGPGTGVAPLRSMIYERAITSEANEGETLIFGNRNRASDFFFEQEWQTLKQSRGLQVLTAFSRDQAAKTYVQDLVRAQSETIHALLKEGVVYVCGSSGKMPQEVRDALVEVFEREAAMTRSDAEVHLARLEKDGRYQQETWG